MIGGLQGDFGDLDIKYLKQNISKCRSQISGSFRRTPRHYAKWLLYSPGKRYRHCAKWLRNSPGKRYQHYAKWLRNSPGKRYQRIRICLTEEVETPSFPIRICLLDVKYPEKVECHLDRIPNVGYPEKMERRKRDRPRVHGVGTPPPNDTERASLSGATPSGFPKRTRGALPYPQGEAHDTREHHTPDDSISYPDMLSGSLAKVPSLATAHFPPPFDGVSGRPVRTSFTMDSK